MRKTTTITITEDDNDFKFILTQVSALQLQRWTAKAAVVLAASGLLDAPKDSGFDLAQIGRAIMQKGFAFIGGIDAEKATGLIEELVCMCAVRASGAANIQLTAQELSNIFYDVRSLLKLETEVLKLNFGFFLSGAPSATPAGTIETGAAPQPSSSPAISIHRSRRS